jgi:hypothetical protein
MLGCRWSFFEQQKWQEFKVEYAPINPMSKSANGLAENPPYTDDERLISRRTGAVNTTFSPSMVIVSTKRKTAQRVDQFCAPSEIRMVSKRSQDTMDLSLKTIRPTTISLSASLSVSNSVTETERTSCHPMRRRAMILMNSKRRLRLQMQ